jgi:parallel beta-helix repeat protein
MRTVDVIETVGRFRNLRRLMVALVVALAVCSMLASTAQARSIIVSSTIQAAVDSAQPGDAVVVPAGRYHENVVVSTDGITIVGLPGAVLDGTGVPGATGIRVAPVSSTGMLHGFRLLRLRVENFARNGVLLQRVDGFAIIGGTFVDNEEYGIFPVRSSNGVITANEASGSDDTGIYVGQSTNVAISANKAELNTIGLDVENSKLIDVTGNRAMGNTLGLVVQALPGLSIPNTTDVTVRGNRFSNNNRPNPSTDPDDLLSRLPAGTGVLTIDADRVTIEGNVVTGNDSVGIGLIALPPNVAALDPRVDALPNDDHVIGNTVLGNGGNPDPLLAPFPGGDLIWDGTGTGNCWAGNNYATAFPSPLPACAR